MRNIFKIVLLLIVTAGTILSCTKKENKIYYEGGTGSVLSSSVTGSIPLSFANQNNLAIKLSWTNPDYKFTTGLSSQDVSYVVEIDTAGANFASPIKLTFGVSKDLTKSFTQGELNNYLFGQMSLVPGISHAIEIRIKSTLSNNNAILYSNVLKFTTIPYTIPPKVAPPTTGQLFLVGSATAGGWNNPVPIPTQQFTKLNPTLFEITVNLIGGQEYLFLPLNGDWGHKYAVSDKTVSGLNSGGDFKFDASDNFPGPSASGTYKISVNFQSGTFTVTKI